MTVIDVVKDSDALSLTLTAQYTATVERVWGMWADPRLLERWWGPPTYPATVVDHTLEPGGRVSYFMTGPDGERFHGWWRILDVDPPRSLQFEDGFATDEGTPNPDLPVTTAVVRIEEAGDGLTRMTLTTTFPSVEAMEQLSAMGMEEGIRSAVGQIDALLAA